MKFKINNKFIGLTILLFLIETAIAVWIHDRWIRPFIGDMLVVILIFFAISSIIETQINKRILAALLFCYVVEIGQYFNLISILGLENYRLARIIIGATFDPFDLLAYTLGAGVIYLINFKESNLYL